MKVEIEVKVPINSTIEKELQKLGITVSSFKIARKSIDARKKPVFVYKVEAELPQDIANKLIDERKAKISEEQRELFIPKVKKSKKVLVVGSGPAGLLASYILSRSGFEVHVIDRGKKVEERVIDVNKFWKKRELDENSNVQFGEGGAGTFSDGKLITRSKDPKKLYFYRLLVEHGAPSEILYLSKPHVGTDKLREIIPNLRKTLQEQGVIFHFSTKLKDLITSKDQVRSVIVQDLKSNTLKEESYDYIVLAIGNSSRDTFSMLQKSGFRLEAKGFAVGLRIVHPQVNINKMQYKRFYLHPKLPPADYAVTFKGKKRSVFSFCMCPGGYVICSSSESEMVVTNGMSNYKRDGEFANSAIVVQVFPEDFRHDPMAAVDFQRNLEGKAYEQGGKDYSMPAQMLDDFLKGNESSRLLEGGYIPEVKPSRLDLLIPRFLKKELINAFKYWKRRIPIFTSDAMLIGVETRTSSPIRIVRDELHRARFRNVFPCGEGSGYSGGITSSAIDGMNTALNIISIEKG